MAPIAGSAWLYLQFLRRRGSGEALERWQTAFLPVYAGWAAVVVVVFFPPLFDYSRATLRTRLSRIGDSASVGWRVRSRPQHRHSRRVAITLLALLMFGGGPASAYRFFRAEREGSLIPRSDAAQRWTSSAWGPGDSLAWQVLDGPDWSPHFANAAEALPAIEAGINVWNSVPTADIRFRSDGVTSRSGERDGRNLILVLVGPGASHARRWQTQNPRGTWETEECDVVLSGEALAAMADEASSRRLHTLVHEFGHCIGLNHAAQVPTQLYSLTGSSVWQKDPTMSAAHITDNNIATDDALGASLLRPAPGWLRTTGSISGTLTLDGEPAPFMSVHVLRNDGGRARASVQVFSDEEGGFLAEGLAPGEHLLWIHPLRFLGAHPSLVERGVLTSQYDLLDPRPIGVRAGEETPVGEFALRSGRDRR